MTPAHGERPMLRQGLGDCEFRNWYWTLAELQGFCRSVGIPASGRKQVVADRVVSYLATGRAPDVAATRRPTLMMPDRFDPTTVVGAGWRCTEPLRAYLCRRLGPSFTFTAAVRDFISRSGVGRPLGEVDEVWRLSRGSRPGSVEEIEPVFEYNRFRHAYRAAHPRATGASVTAAWEQWKAAPVSARSPHRSGP